MSGAVPLHECLLVVWWYKITLLVFISSFSPLKRRKLRQIVNHPPPASAHLAVRRRVCAVIIFPGKNFFFHNYYLPKSIARYLTFHGVLLPTNFDSRNTEKRVTFHSTFI